MEDKHLEILLDVRESLGSLHSKIDSHGKLLDEHKKDDDLAHMRIDSLEETRSQVKGSYAVVVVAVGVVASLVTLVASAWTGH